jgi:hypothetical protein
VRLTLYARLLPELGTDACMHAAGRGYPELLTKCNHTMGPMNPISESTHELLQTLFTELVTVFPDMQLHVGGDEVRARLGERIMMRAQLVGKMREALCAPGAPCGPRRWTRSVGLSTRR